MNHAIGLAVVAGLGVSLLLSLLVQVAKVEGDPGPKSSKLWGGLLLLLGFTVVMFVAALAIKEGWKP